MEGGVEGVEAGGGRRCRALEHLGEFERVTSTLNLNLNAHTNPNQLHCARRCCYFFVPPPTTQTFDVDGTKKELHGSYASNLFNAFLEVDKKLSEEEPFKEGKDSSGTTVNLAMVCEKIIVCANAGDTRCVVSKVRNKRMNVQ